MYDFSHCKLCKKNNAVLKYKLKKMSLYACSDCDFHYINALDDFPEEKPDETLLTDKARNFIESKLPQNTQQLKKDLQFVETHVSLPGARCLDIGSGVGLFAALLKEAGSDPRGIEPQQIFREFAQEKYQLTTNKELIDDPHWQNDYRDYFDLITLWDTLEHVNFPTETIRDAVNLLKPGGYLFLDTPSRDSLFYRSSEWSYRLSGGSKPLLLNRLYSPKPYRHKQIFTRVQLWMLLETSELTVVDESPLHRANKKFVVACQKRPV